MEDRNISSKIDVFTKIALDEVLTQKSQVFGDLEKQYKNACEEYRKEAEGAAKTRLNEEYYAAQRTRNQEIIQATSDSRRALIELRAQLLDEIIKNVTEKLRRYVTTPEYSANLIKDINRACLDVFSAEIYLTPADIKHLRGKTINIGTVSYLETKEDFIGGYKMKINNTIIDNTYKTKLNDAKRNLSIFKID